MLCLDLLIPCLSFSLFYDGWMNFCQVMNVHFHLGLILIDLRLVKWNYVYFMLVCNWWLWLGKQSINVVSMLVGWILLSMVILEVLYVIVLLGCLISTLLCMCDFGWAWWIYKLLFISALALFLTVYVRIICKQINV